MKSFLRTLTLAGAAFAAVTVFAEDAGFAQTSNGAAAFVNGVVISNYDLDQRTALFVATSGVRLTQENLPQIRGQVLRALEDELIELQEAGKRRITVAKAEVDKALQNIASDNNLSVAQILNTLKQAGVAEAVFAQQLTAQIIWQKLVSARYGSDVRVNEQDIDEAMNRLRQGADKPQFLLSEIYLGVDKVEDEIKIRSSAEQFVQQIKQGASFQTVANQFSQTPSAAEGGDIGWVIQGQLPDELDHALTDIRPGQVVGPIRAEGGYYILRVRDRIEPAGSKMMAEAALAPPYDPNAPVPLDRLLVPLPANPDAMLKERAMALANDIKTRVSSCADLPDIAKQLQGSVHQRLGNMKPTDMSAELRNALANTNPGEFAKPFFSVAGLEVIVRCDTATPGVRAFQLPTRNEVEQQLLAQKMSLYSKSYLHDLRRTAIVSELAR